MRAVDTNVLVRLLVRDDPAQARAADEFVSAGAWISHVVLVETVWVLSAVYDLTPAQCATAVARLLEHDALAVQDGDVVQRALERFGKRKSLGFSDCLVVEIAAKAGHLPVGTFDRALGKVPGATWIRGRRAR